MEKITFDLKDFKEFIEKYCGYDESGSLIYLENDQVFMKTHFMINGKQWDEIDNLLKGDINNGNNTKGKKLV